MSWGSGPVQEHLEDTAEALLGVLPCQGSGEWTGELGERDGIVEKEREGDLNVGQACSLN